MSATLALWLGEVTASRKSVSVSISIWLGVPRLLSGKKGKNSSSIVESSGEGAFDEP
jgi:hypothetical protein